MPTGCSALLITARLNPIVSVTRRKEATLKNFSLVLSAINPFHWTYSTYFWDRPCTFNRPRIANRKKNSSTLLSLWIAKINRIKKLLTFCCTPFVPLATNQSITPCRRSIYFGLHYDMNHYIYVIMLKSWFFLQKCYMP